MKFLVNMFVFFFPFKMSKHVLQILKTGFENHEKER